MLGVGDQCFHRHGPAQLRENRPGEVGSSLEHTVPMIVALAIESLL